MTGGFVRCAHCRGFYEVERAKCKWCNYDTVMADDAGKPIVYPDRATVRAIQCVEFDQLPDEIDKQYMCPPRDQPDMICGCLHCGPGGHPFEAIEMRWIDNEQMWACPCTTCGGRGFQIDIHPLEPIWQCADCGHWYRPEKLTHEFAHCPKCGSTHANGWFEDDEDDEDYGEDFEEFAELEEFENVDEDETAFDDGELLPPPDGLMPAIDEPQPWYPGKDEDDERAEYGGEPSIPDDIDFPRNFKDEEPSPRAHDSNDAEDDIPF